MKNLGAQTETIEASFTSTRDGGEAWSLKTQWRKCIHWSTKMINLKKKKHGTKHPGNLENYEKKQI